MTTTEITTGQKLAATAAGVHNASTAIVVQPTVKGAKLAGRKAKVVGNMFANRYRSAKNSKVEQYAAENAAKPLPTEPVQDVPANVVTF